MSETYVLRKFRVKHELTNSVSENATESRHDQAMKQLWIRTRLRELSAVGARKTQRGLAEAMGKPESRVSEIVHKGRRVMLEEIEPMAAYLEMTREELLTQLQQSAPDGKGAKSGEDGGADDAAPAELQPPAIRLSSGASVSATPKLPEATFDAAKRAGASPDIVRLLRTMLIVSTQGDASLEMLRDLCKSFDDLLRVKISQSKSRPNTTSPS